MGKGSLFGYKCSLKLQSYTTYICTFVCIYCRLTWHPSRYWKGWMLHWTTGGRCSFQSYVGMLFQVQTVTRFFACQNPMQQGGGRKGLPKSFLNRFTMVCHVCWGCVYWYLFIGLLGWAWIMSLLSVFYYRKCRSDVVYSVWWQY